MTAEPHFHNALTEIIMADKVRLRLLCHVAQLDLPDCWIGAGFVRSAVWDRLHGNPPQTAWEDIDVVWYCRDRAPATADEAIEARLRGIEPSVNWSVKNQARMHTRNGDAPYVSVADAISRWPETATAIAIRQAGVAIEAIAPHGLSDLFSLILRPTPAFSGEKTSMFIERVRHKQWLERWPKLIMTTGGDL